MSHVIGLDVGTSGIKAGAMDRQGRLSMVLGQPYSLLFSGSDRVEIDLNDLWQTIVQLIRKISGEIKGEGGVVDGLALSCFCSASVFMDENGDPLCPGIMYLDKRSRLESEWIRETAGREKLFEITKNRMEPGMFTASTLLWVKNHLPEVYAKTYKWGHVSTFILRKLTGEFVLDWTQASYSGMFDMVRQRWAEELIGLYGVDADKLPRLVSPMEIVGTLVCGEELDLGPVPVVAGGADTASSTFALGVRPGQVFESVGTSDVLTLCTEKTGQFDDRFMNRCHIVKNQWLSHGAMSTPGACIRWFHETFLAHEGPLSQMLDELPRQSDVGANGLFFLPYMHGERTPIWDINARGAFVGLHLGSTKADMLQAILEGCAFGLKQIFSILRDKYGLSPEKLSSIGGGAKNRHWAQIKANVLNINIEVKEVTETAVLGAALLAGLAAGYFASVDEALQAVDNRTLFAVEPEPDAVRKYEQLAALYNDLYPALRSHFANAARLK